MLSYWWFSGTSRNQKRFSWTPVLHWVMAKNVLLRALHSWVCLPKPSLRPKQHKWLINQVCLTKLLYHYSKHNSLRRFLYWQATVQCSVKPEAHAVQKKLCPSFFFLDVFAPVRWKSMRIFPAGMLLASLPTCRVPVRVLLLAPPALGVRWCWARTGICWARLAALRGCLSTPGASRARRFTWHLCDCQLQTW